MNVLIDMYNKKLAENYNMLHFWEDYLHNLKSLDFDIYADKLKVPTLVPIGNRIFFRGEMKHTNEVTVSLGADYFAKCSIKQAEILRQHRITGAESKVEMYRKEQEFLENQMFGKNNVFEDPGREIVEMYTEEDEKLWKEKHKENVRKYKQGSRNQEEKGETIADDELWERLEELELQEDLENELAKLDKNSSKNLSNTEIKDNTLKEIIEVPKFESKSNSTIDYNKDIQKVILNSKTDLLQKVLVKQTELEQKLLEIKCKDRIKSRTESDLMTRLQEMEELDELEDEMDRLDDILETEDAEDENVNESTPVSKHKRSVSFADDSETLGLTFQHSNVESSAEPYDETKGINKPSDIYEAFPNYFGGATSILKKSKYESNKYVTLVKNENGILEDITEEDCGIEREIIVKDVVEKEEQRGAKIWDVEVRPTSLFKQRRQQRKLI